ncbi:hypothetical protein V8G61_06055 [Gaetbulibacter sp. M240]|uniref:hypothetical protein n=1 Tax=Gaetbulibacter sp. M240 TaxID=3126511 RepID=UPI00374F0F2A
MKRQIEILKLIILGLLITSNVYAQAQETGKPYKGFLRVSSQTGDIIEKGRFLYVNDSLVALKKGKKVTTINKSLIGFIKTKRSGVNNVVIGAVAGGTLGVALGVGTSDPDSWVGYSASEGAFAFGLLGTLGGGLLGGLLNLVKDPMVIMISGNEANWQTFKKIMQPNHNN